MLCVFLYMCVRGKREVKWLFFIFLYFYDFKHLFFPFTVYIELYVVKWLKPFYDSAHVKRKKKKKKKTSRHPQRETKALNHTEHLPLSRPAPLGAGQHCTARLGSAQLGLAPTESLSQHFSRHRSSSST